MSTISGGFGNGLGYGYQGDGLRMDSFAILYHTLTGVVVDTFRTPNLLYLADSANHRIRYFLDEPLVTGRPADYIVRTLAGSGAVGGPGAYGGDGGAASAAQLSSPTYLAATPAGLLVSDSGNHRVRLVTLGGGSAPIITTLAGSGEAGEGGDGGPAAAAQLRAPAGLAVEVVGRRGWAASSRTRATTACAACCWPAG